MAGRGGLAELLRTFTGHTVTDGRLRTGHLCFSLFHDRWLRLLHRPGRHAVICCLAAEVRHHCHRIILRRSIHRCFGYAFRFSAQVIERQQADLILRLFRHCYRLRDRPGMLHCKENPGNCGGCRCQCGNPYREASPAGNARPCSDSHPYFFSGSLRIIVQPFSETICPVLCHIP